MSLNLFVNPGDEVICLSPPWFGYEMMVRFHSIHDFLVTNLGGVVKKVPLREEDGFDINVENIRASITPRTKALIINSTQSNWKDLPQVSATV